jgi:hypothetical protein
VLSQHKGLRLSLIGLVIVLASVVLFFLAGDVVPAIGMLVGGVLVWAGLFWTLFGYYASPHQPTPGP